jgi:hypothetical protein
MQFAITGNLGEKQAQIFSALPLPQRVSVQNDKFVLVKIAK